MRFVPVAPTLTPIVKLEVMFLSCGCLVMAAGSQMETLPTMLNKLFGVKTKIISGYKGGSDVFLAMERGEVMGRCGGLIASTGFS